MMIISEQELKNRIEAALFRTAQCLPMERLIALFNESDHVASHDIEKALALLGEDYHGRSLEVVYLAGGWRIQIRACYAAWVNQALEHKPVRYSRALLETLTVIVYRQPVTRSEIEHIRGVSLHPRLIQTLLEQGWIEVAGHRKSPGCPSLYGTTLTFLDHFNLRSLDQLPDFDSFSSQSFAPEAPQSAERLTITPSADEPSNQT